jgi:microcin C transport system permease protein
MSPYIIKRILLIPPTLLGILFFNFLLVQFAPGGPVEQMIAEIQGTSMGSGANIGGSGGAVDTALTHDHTLGQTVIDPELIEQIKKQYGMDKPFWTRFFLMVKKYAQFDLGESYFRGKTVVALIREKLPVSISLGFWSALLVYAISIPLGIAKAVRAGTRFDVWTSFFVILGYAVPGFLFGTLLILFFAGGSFFSWFPLKGLVSANWEQLSWAGKILDYAWHMTLPLLTQVLGGFASLTLLTKNAFLEEMGKQYVLTARAKGLTAKRILWAHIFRNACLVLVVSFPRAFLHLLFTGALLVEILFSLDGLGFLGFNATLTRDYPVIFGTLFVFTLFSLVLHIIGDLLYRQVDPRINFERRQ